MVDSPGGQSGGQRFGDMLLTHHIGEGRRSVFPIERHVSRLPTTPDGVSPQQRFGRREQCAGSQAVDGSGQFRGRRKARCDPDVLIVRIFPVRE